MIVNLNLTEYMCSPDRLSYVQAYAEAVDAALTSGKLTGPLTTTCPECGCNFSDGDDVHQDSDHIIIATTSDTYAVVVACEGYFVVNPNLVGIDSPMWSDWQDNTSGGTLPQGVTGPDMDRDQLLFSAIMDLDNGQILNVMQAAAELPGSAYDRLSKAYHEIA